MPLLRWHAFVLPSHWRLWPLLAVLAGAPQAQAQAQHPADQWEFGIETGYLTKVRHNSPLDYRIVPTTLVWRSPPMFDIWRGKSGARLTVRHRMGLVMERNRVIPEGAAATAVAAALTGRVGTGKVVCILSGGNIDSQTLLTIPMIGLIQPLMMIDPESIT